MKKNIAILAFTVLVSSHTFGAEPMEKCVDALMLEPTCYDKTNATNYCKSNSSMEMVEMLQSCVKKLSRKGDSEARKADIMAGCGGGYVSTKTVSVSFSLFGKKKVEPEVVKESKCIFGGDPLVVNDSKKDKVIEKESSAPGVSESAVGK